LISGCDTGKISEKWGWFNFLRYHYRISLLVENRYLQVITFRSV